MLRKKENINLKYKSLNILIIWYIFVALISIALLWKNVPLLIADFILNVGLLIMFCRVKKNEIRTMKRMQECVEILFQWHAPKDVNDQRIRWIEDCNEQEWASFVEVLNNAAKKTREENTLLQLRTMEAKMSALQSTINPHFLYNSLEVMRSNALDVKNYKVAEMAEAMSLLFRYSINRPENLCTIKAELENVRQYFIIQKYRYHDRFVLEIEMDSYENVEDCLLPRLSLQPIVENAIHHGLEKKDWRRKSANSHLYK